MESTLHDSFQLNRVVLFNHSDVRFNYPLILTSPRIVYRTFPRIVSSLKMMSRMDTEIHQCPMNAPHGANLRAISSRGHRQHKTTQWTRICSPNWFGCSTEKLLLEDSHRFVDLGLLVMYVHLSHGKEPVRQSHSWSDKELNKSPNSLFHFILPLKPRYSRGNIKKKRKEGRISRDALQLDPQITNKMMGIEGNRNTQK